MSVTKDDLRRYAVARSLFPPTTLKRAVHKLGFVQADPIRAPARAQDLTLRHRVRNYRAGDLERRYAGLGVQEDFFVNYGFVAEEVQALMHPRGGPTPWPRSRAKHVEAMLDFVRARGEVHPREVDATSHTARSRTIGADRRTRRRISWMACITAACCESCGAIAASASTPCTITRPGHSIARRDCDNSMRWWTSSVRAYAPLPGATLSWLINRLRYAVPQWRRELKAAQARARERLAHARESTGSTGIGRPTIASPARHRTARVRLLAPFDPDRLGSPTVRTVLGVGIPLRSLHAGPQAAPGLLRAAAAVARSRDRMGERLGERRRPAVRYRLHCGKPPRDPSDSGANSSAGAGPDGCVPGPGRIDDEDDPHQLLQGLKLPPPRGPCGRAHQGRHRRRHCRSSKASAASTPSGSARRWSRRRIEADFLQSRTCSPRFRGARRLSPARW